MLGPDGKGAAIKATLEQQAELVAAAPDVYSVAAYTGRFGWVAVDVAEADGGEVAELLEEAWRRTAPKSVVKAFDTRD
ncbi:MAG: MmcQ/YjbR family DNA-binding protein [Frankiales bacterium]|nr:MmcQ/YjbR family DNA-binding protein [Frankiales bacterium]